MALKIDIIDYFHADELTQETFLAMKDIEYVLFGAIGYGINNKYHSCYINREFNGESNWITFGEFNCHKEIPEHSLSSQINPKTMFYKRVSKKYQLR